MKGAKFEEVVKVLYKLPADLSKELVSDALLSVFSKSELICFMMDNIDRVKTDPLLRFVELNDLIITVNRQHIVFDVACKNADSFGLASDDGKSLFKLYTLLELQKITISRIIFQNWDQQFVPFSTYSKLVEVQTSRVSDILSLIDDFKSQDYTKTLIISLGINNIYDTKCFSSVLENHQNKLENIRFKTKFSLGNFLNEPGYVNYIVGTLELIKDNIIWIDELIVSLYLNASPSNGSEIGEYIDYNMINSITICEPDDSDNIPENLQYTWISKCENLRELTIDTFIDIDDYTFGDLTGLDKLTSVQINFNSYDCFWVSNRLPETLERLSIPYDFTSSNDDANMLKIPKFLDELELYIEEENTDIKFKDFSFSKGSKLRGILICNAFAEPGVATISFAKLPPPTLKYIVLATSAYIRNACLDGHRFNICISPDHSDELHERLKHIYSNIPLINTIERKVSTKSLDFSLASRRLLS